MPMQVISLEVHWDDYLTKQVTSFTNVFIVLILNINISLFCQCPVAFWKDADWDAKIY